MNKKKKRKLGHLSKRHSAPARKAAIIRRAAVAPENVTLMHIVKTEKN